MLRLQPLSTVLLTVVACTPAPSTASGPTTLPTTPTTKPATPPPPGPDIFADPDDDDIMGACDACPDAPETFNTRADSDGCPETEAEIATVLSDPRTRFSLPIVQIGITSDKLMGSVEAAWSLEPEIESVLCFGSASTETRGIELAKQLCNSVEKSLRAAGSKTTLASYGRTEIDKGEHLVAMFVTKAAGVEIWKWDGKAVVRATPKPEVQSRPTPDNCEWQGFDEHDHDKPCFGICLEPGKGFRVQWPAGERHRPPKKPAPKP